MMERRKMIQRKKPRFLFLRMAVFFFAVFLINACTTEKTPVFPESSSTPVVVSASASGTEKTDGSFSAVPDEVSEMPEEEKQQEEKLHTPFETVLPSPTPFYEPEIEEDPSIQYLKEPDQISTDTGKHKPIPLWHSKEYLPYGTKSYMPSITPYLAEGEETKISVIIFPGGGYETVSMGREGTEAAEYLCEKLNVNAFVVKYRVAPSNYRAILSDALRAVRFVRFYSEQFHTDRNKIAVLGFSAGGHLAMMTGEHFDYGKTGDDIDAESSRPDAVFLCYPVQTMLESFAHKGSRKNFLGKEDTQDNRVRFSAEKGLRPDMPPVCIVHSEDDRIVPIENSIETVRAMEKEGLDITYRWFPKGGHGYGIAGVKWYQIDWPMILKEWLEERGW